MAGWGAPTVRPADRCHFLLGFRASGRSAPAFGRTSALRGARPAGPPRLLPKSGRRRISLPRSNFPPGDRQLRALPRMRPRRRQAGVRGSGRLLGRREQPGARSPGVRMGSPRGGAPSRGGGRSAIGRRGAGAVRRGPPPGARGRARPARPGRVARPRGGSRGGSPRGLGGAGGECPAPPRPRPAPEPPGTQGGGRLGRSCPRRRAPARSGPGKWRGARRPSRGREGRGRGPRPSPDGPPRDRGRRQSRGPGEARPARGRGPWRDSCGRAGIFSLNLTDPCRLRSPRAFPLPKPGGAAPKKKPQSPGQRVPGGPGAASSLHSAAAWGQRTCHRGPAPPAVPGLGSNRGHQYPLLATTRSLPSAWDSPERARWKWGGGGE